MIADYFSNPMQLTLFHIFREINTARKNISTMIQLIDELTNERVGSTDDAGIDKGK